MTLDETVQSALAHLIRQTHQSKDAEGRLAYLGAKGRKSPLGFLCDTQHKLMVEKPRARELIIAHYGEAIPERAVEVLCLLENFHDMRSQHHRWALAHQIIAAGVYPSVNFLKWIKLGHTNVD